MERVLRLIADYQWWIFGAFGLLLLFFLRRALLARREGARSIFKLEQEQARGKYARSVLTMVIILVLVASVFALNMYLLPAMDRPPIQRPQRPLAHSRRPH